MLADARQKAAKLAAKAKDAAIEQGLKAKEAAMEQAAKAKEAAKEQASKGKEYALEQASKGKDAATIMRAERTEGLLDERLQQKQATIVALQKCYHDLAASLKHEADRANKSAKSAKETHEVLERLKEAGSGASLGAARLAPALSSEAALSGCWEAFAAAIEVQLLGPARQLTAVFQEAEKVYAAYCALANELASKQSALKRVHGLAAMVTKDEDRIQDKTASAHDQARGVGDVKGCGGEVRSQGGGTGGFTRGAARLSSPVRLVRPSRTTSPPRRPVPSGGGADGAQGRDGGVGPGAAGGPARGRGGGAGLRMLVRVSNLELADWSA